VSESGVRLSGPNQAADDRGVCSTLRNQTVEIGRGDPGIERTVVVMRQIIQQATGMPIVRDHAERAVAGVQPGRPLEEVRAVVEYLRSRVNYRRDPITHEWIQTPWRVLACQIDQGQTPQLDCDDLTVLSLSLLGSIGFDTVIRVVSTRPDGQYNHVYGLAELPRSNAATPIDLTRAWAPRGAPWPVETRVWEVPV
jgi:hypothetical protein